MRCGVFLLFLMRKTWLGVRALVVLLFVTYAAAALRPTAAQADVHGRPIASIPAEVASEHFRVTVGKASSPVFHAVTGYYLLNFDIAGPTQITVTADDPHYWDRGVEVQPMRLGIRPRREGATITFLLKGPAKVSLTRPGDFFSDSEMLFLFANQPESAAPVANAGGVRYYAPGVYHENIDAQNGDRIYLAPGAVLYGSLNVWGVHDVSVSGGGTLIYDGPQNPDTDEGWMHKPNWHVIVMDNASNISISGITCIVRSRTWMIQMKDSRGITFRNIKVIGGSANNANQDGMDWLGGGDTLVQDSFFRAADDVFAMQGNWEGYSDEAMLTPGHLVSNVVVENSVLSTSISNIVRLGWPKKIFDSHGFTMRNSDVIQMGVGGCGVPFALFALWADPGGFGRHADIHFEDVRLDNWYSFMQIEQPNPGVEGVEFTRVTAMDGPGMVASTVKGEVHAVTMHDVNLSGGDNARADADVPLSVTGGAEEARYDAGDSGGGFLYTAKKMEPFAKVKFTAPKRAGVRYTWFFGDGSSAEGRVVRHAFPDDQGTLLDGSGRFRVLLSSTANDGTVLWHSQSVVVSRSIKEASVVKELAPGLSRGKEGPAHTEEGLLRVPSGGGYTITLLTSTTASLAVDGISAQSRKAHAQVCGSPGDAVQAVQVSLTLARGDHRLLISRGAEVENAGEGPVLWWEGPGIARQRIPAAVLLHEGLVVDGVGGPRAASRR